MSEAAAEAVVGLLAATREERLKRGQYKRFTAEQRDEIAEYAVQHGQSAAAQHFSAKAAHSNIGVVLWKCLGLIDHHTKLQADVAIFSHS